MSLTGSCRKRQLTAFRRRYRRVFRYSSRTTGTSPSPSFFKLFQNSILLFKSLVLGPAPLPAVLPIADKKSKAETIDLETWLEADA